MANFSAVNDFLGDNQKTKKKEFQEEQLDFIEESTVQTHSQGLMANKETIITATPSKILWGNRSKSETKENIQFTLYPSQQDAFKQAAGERGIVRTGKGGVKVPNPSEFLQKIIDQKVWEAIEFIIDNNLMNDFNVWKSNKE